jgi:integrator complex subunit 6
MIVVFVVDTSPSMGQRFSSTSDADDAFASKDRSAGSGMSRLDLAKMAVESLTKGLTRRVIEHNNQLQQEPPAAQKSLHNMGLGFSPPDQFLLLSTGRQYPHHPAVSSCGAGGRLLVGYGEYIMADQSTQQPGESSIPHGANLEGFQKELKGLQATVWQPPNKSSVSVHPTNSPFPEDGGGAEGLNVALSAGLQLLSRYRLKNRSTENFGMGRLPSPAMLSPSGGGQAANALQPACLVLLTDGECLRKPPSEGGGTLKVQFGNMPLREFYKEPFRWDQRVFCLGVGGRDGVSSTQYLHSQLRALCEVTGGCHMMLRSSTSLSQVTDILLRLISPPRPRELPIPDPLRQQPLQSSSKPVLGSNGAFVNGGPICCFQSLEATEAEGGNRPIHRAMLLYVPHNVGQSVPSSDNVPNVFQPPTWCIPEAFFPSKALDTLPPRPAQPLLTFSYHPKLLGSKSFDAGALMNALQKLDQMLATRSLALQGPGHSQHHVKTLQRDVYVCEWLSVDGRGGKAPVGIRGLEYFPVLIQGAGKSLSEGDESFLNFGILHIPQGASTLACTTSRDARYTTLTLLPPEPQILLPLLIRAAEAELRAMKKATSDVTKDAAAGMGATAGLIQKQSVSVARNVHLDENWRTEFRAYLFRVPPYYQNALKRALRHILPASVHSMLSAEGIDAVASQCFSKGCLQKIRNGEQVARETTDRLERQEAELRRRGLALAESHTKSVPIQRSRWASDNAAEAGTPVIGYGQYDPRSTTERYLAALRNMPPPWRSGVTSNVKSRDGARVETAAQDALSETASAISMAETRSPSALDVLGDLPASCLLPYYESRRRWIFGGSGLTTRGLHVEGVNNDGSNSQRRKGKWSIDDEPLISLAGVGASTLNHTTTEKMGNYRERLLWSRSPIVGYGSNETSGVAATTAPDGSPCTSVDDDAMPITFFDPKTGEFSDSVQARVRSRLLVNFGNPFKEKRGDSLVPERFRSQSPPAHGLVADDDGPPLGSPPHDSFSGEGEGEAVFAGKPAAWKVPARPTSPRKRESTPLETETSPPETKKAKTEPAVITPVPQDHPSKLQTAPKPSVLIPPPPKPRNPSGNPPRPAPPPKPPQRKPPPPPPPSGSNKQPAEPQTEKNILKAPPPAKPPAPPPKEEEKQNASPAPTLQADVLNPDAKQKQIPVPPQQLDMQSPDVKPKVDLTPGWVCVWSKSQKRWYFFDTKSNRSVWQWPPPPS